MQRTYTVGFYVDKGGKMPVAEYLSKYKGTKTLGILLHVIESLSNRGLAILDSNMAKIIKMPIYELRKDHHRILFAPDSNRFVLLHAFYKDTNKTETADKIRALDNYDDYLKTKKFSEINFDNLRPKGK